MLRSVWTMTNASMWGLGPILWNSFGRSLRWKNFIGPNSSLQWWPQSTLKSNIVVHSAHKFLCAILGWYFVQNLRVKYWPKTYWPKRTIVKSIPDELEDAAVPDQHQPPEALAGLPGVRVHVAVDVRLLRVRWNGFRVLRNMLGSMLWSQFYAIFDNFRQKIGVFLKTQCYDQNFALFWVKNANFLQNFSAKIF
jgi:hypothetical protein